MQRSAGGSYVCWRCLSRGLQTRPSLVRRPFSAAASRSLSALRAHGARTFATVQEPLAEPKDDAKHIPIREQLRRWSAENQVEAPRPMAADDGEIGEAHNLLTRARVVDESALQRARMDSAADQLFSDRDGSLDLLPPPNIFQPGDLVEYSEDGHAGIPVIAICLGYINGCYHFYTTGGKWFPVPGLQTHFVYPNFVSEADLKPVVDRLPKANLPLKSLVEMSRLDMGPDRVVGARLLSRMTVFQQDTDAMLQKYATRLEKAHELVSGDDGRKYLTLEQIRQRLLFREDLKMPAPPHVLYAVYRTVVSDDTGFRIVGRLGNAPASLFEVSSREDVSLIQNMQTLVRLFTDTPGRVGVLLSSLTKSQLHESQLGQFVLRAREAIDNSRRSRDWTPHGMLGPAKQQSLKRSSAWTAVDTSIMHFMLLWAGYDQFSASSRFHWIGSAILRATGKYKDSEYLSATTAWTFLQELGYITPWDMHGRFIARVPGVSLSRERGFAPFKLGPEGIRPFLTQDVFDGVRHDWASLKAFAIDSKDTVDIDDAVSLEPTDVPGQHWVHIHVADPASRVRHQNALGARASLTPLTLYLPGHYSNIWGVKDELQKHFSLAPDRSCLTFSGLVSEDGELLDYKITPGKLHEFVYMSPEDANAAVDVGSSDKSTERERFVVGKLPREKPPTRKMTAPSELQPADLESLKTLYRLADALKQKRLAKGAVPKWAVRPNVKAFFDDTSVEHTPPGLMTCHGDPAIEISWDHNESSMVSQIMVLAGEIAARWSAERNIPIPYLSQPDSAKNQDLIRLYTEKVYYPLIESGEEPTQAQFTQLRTLIGPDELSTRPAPHYFMGVDMYAKVTSPLRRYSDLLAHWQIENALVQEMKTGKVAEANLPFSRKDLDQNVLPWLVLRQRVIRRLGSSAGSEAYKLQALVRAWKYPSGEHSALPETFRLTIKQAQNGSVHFQRKIMVGALDWFGLHAWLVPQGLGPLGLRVADVREGDVFEVKLLDVNVHLGDVFVEAVGKVSVQKDREVAQLEAVSEDAEEESEGAGR
ncbi:unnamed protein product [Discula destructiva]